MTTPAHRLLDHLLDDLKKELFAKMQQNVVLELEKRKRDLQSMVENMLEERRTEMLEVLTDKVHKEIKQEFEMYAQATTDAMDSLMGDMKYQLCVHIERMVEKEVSQRFQDQNQSRTTYVNKGVSSLSYIRKCRFFVSVNLSKLTATLADYIQIHIHIRTDEAREQNRPLYNLGVIQRWTPDGAV